MGGWSQASWFPCGSWCFPASHFLDLMTQSWEPLSLAALGALWLQSQWHRNPTLKKQQRPLCSKKVNQQQKPPQASLSVPGSVLGPHTDTTQTHHAVYSPGSVLGPRTETTQTHHAVYFPGGFSDTGHGFRVSISEEAMENAHLRCNSFLLY